jgi:hypothetical protein
MMWLESLRDSGGIVVLIHGRDEATFAALVSSFKSLASEKGGEIAIHKVPGVSSIGECQVVATNQRERPGIWVESAPGAFRWSQDSEGWLQVAELAEPVGRAAATSGVHFQFLERLGSATLILSTERSW